MRQPYRLASGGRIDRTQSFPIFLDGRRLKAHPGDTLASALLADGVSVVARSFKYHRPRGIYAAGVEEPNALVGLRSGARGEPNTLATMAEAFDGLDAVGQNAWPSVRFDVGAINQAFAPFLAAGFYYKTFMGPGKYLGFGLGGTTRFWMMCERFIRKAAGVGRAPGLSDPDVYEKVNAYCDVLVIGSGPAGLAAALTAGRTGARVILAEQDFAVGGSLLSAPVGSMSDQWLAETTAALQAMANVRIFSRTTVFGAYDSDVYGAVERVSDHLAVPENHQPRQRFWQIKTKQAVLATGAIERPMVFGGNDKPGVMLAGAVRTYLNRYAVLPARDVVVAVSNDSGYAVVRDLAKAGAMVTLVDARADVPDGLVSAVREVGVIVRLGHAVLSAVGSSRVIAAIVAPVDQEGRTTGAVQRIKCGLIAISGGWSPAVHLWSQRGPKPIYDAEKVCFVPEVGALATLRPVGAALGTGGTARAIAEGMAAGGNFDVSTEDNETDIAADILGDDWVRDIGSCWAFKASNGKARGKAFVDLQHDVTQSDIDLAHREGFRSIEHLKRYTTSGMAMDQGKLSNVSAIVRMAELRQLDIPEVGTTTFRPPYTPVSLGSIAGHRHGAHFHPVRQTPLHEWHLANGARMTDAGAWKRAWYYPEDDEGVREAYIREAAHVRQHVGIVDVSTLGKIAVQGPDAGEFLNRVYANGMASLKLGRLRYGVMLRDDGFVLDDGTVARLAENDYLVTTTTAQAGAVLAFMEELAQTAWRDLRVHVTSVTDQWAAAAVAGPRSRELLSAVTSGTDLSAEALPSGHFVAGMISGVGVRLHRMSYSGELAYEVFMPAKAAMAVWQAIIDAGGAYNLKPYGTEAMGALRIEKGHVAGPEIDGRTTLGDLGLEGMAKKYKPFVGSVLRQRPQLIEAGRPRLVGLKIEGDKGAQAGALLFGAHAPIIGHGEGLVTSTTYSPALSRNIALGLLANGPERMGERIGIVDLLSETRLFARVVSHHFYDPAGVRQNG